MAPLFRSVQYCFLFLGIFMLPVIANGQEINNDTLVQRVDTIENPVYKPVISLSYGVLNFQGDVQDSYKSPAIGSSAVKLSISSYLDKKHLFVANFNYMLGQLSGNSYSYSDISRNLNFKSRLSTIGFDVEYRFGHLFQEDALVRPYVFLGMDIIGFNAKGDLTDAGGLTYYYWSDGSIRDVEESVAGPSGMLYRDYMYETDLRFRESQEFGMGDYSQWAFSIPAGMGFHFKIDRRTFFSLGLSYHYAFTDVLDNVAYKGTSVQGNKGNDSYIYTHLSLHFDLFSDPPAGATDLLYADVEFDSLFFADEDGDLVLDVKDHCPGTAYGLEVDTLGCPLDGDVDGVPDYLDKELDSAPDVWVDDNGVTVSEEEFISLMQHRNYVMPREDVETYLSTIRAGYKLYSEQEIPDRYKVLDVDADGYISFDELLKTVDQYFDFQLDLGLDELRELNEFFFSQ